MEPNNTPINLTTPNTPTTPVPPTSTSAMPTPTTNHTPKKNNKTSLISLIICALLALGGIAFGVYTMISTNNQSSELSNLKSELTEKNTTITTLEAELAALKADNDTSTSPETPTDPYHTFADNLAKNYSGSVFGTYYHYDGTENIQYTVSANVDNNHLELIDLNNDNQKIAEADDIISVYFIKVGNGGVPYFYLINKNGEVSRIDISEDSSHTIEKVGDYHNIVSIIEGGDLLAWLIDIEGNIYKTY